MMSLPLSVVSDPMSGLLEDYRAGCADVLDRLLPLVYEDLRRIARRGPRQFGDPSVDATCLLHETYLKLRTRRVLDARDRGHFLAVCARAMRRFVLERAHESGCAARRSGLRLPDLDAVDITREADAEQLRLIDAALRRLEAVDENLVRAFECRYFAGLTDEETSLALERPLCTVQRDWIRACAWVREVRETTP